MGNGVRVCHYAEFEDALAGGIETSIRHQRAALERADIPYTTDPTDPHDVLHLNVVGPLSAYQLLRARRRGTPTVFHVHSTGDDFEGSFRFSDYLAPAVDRWTRALYDRADRLLFVSGHTASLLRERGVTTPTQVVTNGIDPEPLAGFETLRDRRARYDIDGPAVVNLAHVFKRKGVDDFVEAAVRLPETDFVWFGSRMNRLLTSGAATRAVRRAPANVRFPGFVEDKREAFAVGDVFFFPSHAEHQPLALLEALYCGMPIVVRDLPHYDWLEHDETCLKADSVDGFVSHLESLLDDPGRRERLGANARELAEEHTIDAVAADLERAYAAVRDGA